MTTALTTPAPQEQQQHPVAMPALDPSSPAGTMLAAMQQGASLDQIERMMDLQERWERREAEKAYNASFASFKAEKIRVVRGRTRKDGPLKGQSYAELNDYVEAVTPALSRHGLSASWSISKDERDWIEVTCTIKHVRGHFESASMGGHPDTGPGRNAIQARASAVKYLERYTLQAACGLSDTGEDDDGMGGQPAAPLTYPQEDFEKNLPQWVHIIKSGRKSLEQILSTISTKAPLTPQQEAHLRQACQQEQQQ